MDVALEVGEHLADRPGHGEDVRRVVLGLGDDLPLAVDEHATEVVRLVDDGGVGGGDEVRPHLAHHRDEGLLEELQGDRVDVSGAHGAHFEGPSFLPVE